MSLNSAREEVYTRYYRPHGYTFQDVKNSIAVARRNGLWVSLNLLYFPGITDTEEELDALSRLVGEQGVSMIQWRNLNIDPEYYLELMKDVPMGPSMGLKSFMKRLRKACPWLRYGYFNPYVGERAQLSAPMPGEWHMPEPDMDHVPLLGSESGPEAGSEAGFATDSAAGAADLPDDAASCPDGDRDDR